MDLAVEQALRASAFEEALQYLDQTLAIGAGSEPGREADLRAKKGAALRSLGRGEDAVKEWEAALSSYQRLGNAEAVARTCYEIGNQQFWLSRWQEATDICRRGLSAIGNPQTADGCRLLAFTGLLVGSTDNYAAGSTMLEDAERAAERLSDQHLLGHVLSRRAALDNMCGEFRRAVDVGNRAAHALRHVRDLWELADVLGFLELNLNYVGRLDDGVTCDDELRPLALRIGHHSALGCADWASLPRDLMRTGDLEAFDAATRHKLEAWRRAGLPDFFAHLFVGAAQFWKGQWPESVASFERGISAGFYPSWIDMMWGWLFVVKAYAAHDDALQVFTTKQDALPSPDKPASSGSWHLLQLVVEGLAILGQKREAHTLYP